MPKVSVLAAALLHCASASHVGNAFADTRIEKHVGPAWKIATVGRDISLVTDASVIAGISRGGNLTWRIVATDDETAVDVTASKQGSFFAIQTSAGKLQIRSRSIDGAAAWDADVDCPPAAAMPGTVLAAAGSSLAVAHGSRWTVFDAVSGVVQHSYESCAGYGITSVVWHADGSHTWALAIPDSATHGSAISSATVIAGMSDVRMESSVSFPSPVQAGAVYLVGGVQGVVIALDAKTHTSVQVACVASRGKAPTYAALDLVEALKAVAAAPDAAATISSLSLVYDTSGADSGSPSSAYFHATLSNGHSLVLRVNAGATECSDTLKAVVHTEKHATSSSATVEGSTYLFMVEDSTLATVYMADGTVAAQSTLLPAEASRMVQYHGHVWRSFAIPIIRAEAGSSAAVATGSVWNFGLRVVIVYADGYTVSASASSGLIWEKDEGAACTAAGLLVDVRPLHRRVASAQSKGDMSGESSGEGSLTMQARWKAQAEAVQNVAKMAMQRVKSLLQQLAANPTTALKGLLGLGSKPSRVHGSLAPTVDTGLEHVIVARTSVGGGHHVCRPRGYRQPIVSQVVGALTTKSAETGAVLWTLPLPAQASSQQHAAHSRPTEWKEIAVPTRLRPIRGHEAEVLLVESGPLYGQEGRYGVWLSLVDVTTGTVVASSSYTANTPLERLARTPVVHTGSQRLSYMTLHGGSHPEGVLVPAYTDVLSSLQGLGAEFVIAAPTYDAAADVEGVAGYVLSSTASGSQIDLVGSSAGLPLSAISLTRVWSHALAHGALGEVLLGVHLSGTGDHAVLSSATTGEDHILQKAVSEESEGVASLEAALASGAGPHAPISPVTVLGDDSLLLKYSLGTSLVVAVGRPASAATLHTSFERARQEVRRAARTRAGLPLVASAAPSGTSGVGVSNLTVHVLSAVSGRVVRVQRTEGGQGPVGIVVADNWASYTYWNGVKGRPEIATLAAYEGALDKTALTPWSGSPIAQAARNAPAVVSAHSAPMPAIVHRTFALPVSLKPDLLTVTRTHLGISAHFLLLGSAAEGVFWMDRKLVDPRRPMPEAVKDVDKAEGLLPYSPVLPFRHQWLLTHGDRVARLHTLVSAPSGLESTSLVLGLGVDTMLARAAPARAWDALDREFNGSLFLALLAVLGVVTWALGQQVKRKQLNDAWK